jgi:hypothetical protein
MFIGNEKAPRGFAARPLIVPRRRREVESALCDTILGLDAVTLGMEGSQIAVLAGDEGLDFFIRKNEAILGGMVGFFIFSMHLDEVGGLVEFVSFLSEADGLKLAEQGEGAFELAGEALAVDAEIGQGAGLGIECRCDGESVPDFVGHVFHGGGLVGRAQTEEIVFESADAVLPPGGVRQGLDQLGFSGSFGVVLGFETLDVLLIGFEVVGGEDDGLAGESVAEGIQ